MVKQSLTKVVQGLLEEDPLIIDSLERGYANISAVARLLKPEIERRMGRRVNLSGIITAIRRAKSGYKPSIEHIKVLADSVITIRTNLAKISIERTRKNLEKARLLSTEFPEAFFQVLEGEETLTLIMDQRVLSKIKPKFRDDEIIDEKNDLSAIIIQSPREIINTPRCISEFYNVISRRGINIEETISCCTETIIVLRMSDSAKAYNTLIHLIEDARRRLSQAK
ncbi:MAG: hypothetical protein QXR84_06970 [Candidatus Bathyarchaeia archaeon]|nr:hypothetical protein [Candidatus Bathyarchaeota archaeon]